MSNPIAEQLRKVGEAIEGRRLSVADAMSLASEILREANDQGAFEGILKRIVGAEANIIAVAKWVDDEIHQKLERAYERGDQDDIEEVGQKAIVEGCAKVASLIGEAPSVEPETREEEVLQVLFGENAFDIRSKMTIQQITTQTAYKRTVNDYKNPVSKLVTTGLVKTKQGSKGGCWLTRKGKDEAQN